MDNSFLRNSDTLALSNTLVAREGIVAMRQMWGQLWKPPAEALDSIGSVLSEHWRKARENTVRLFWSTPVSWLEPRKVHASVTTSPAAEDSSGTRPGPHRY